MHAFLLQGIDVLYLVHLPLFHFANHRRQVIATGTLLSKEATKVYKAAYKKDPTEPLVIFSREKSVLQELLGRGSFVGDIYHGSPVRYPYVIVTFSLFRLTCCVLRSDGTYRPIFSRVGLKFKVLINRSLDRCDLQKEYPRKMPFYLYGTPKSLHIDHILLWAPNAPLSATAVELRLDVPLTHIIPAEGLQAPLVTVLEDVYEATMQPFGESNEPTVFAPGRTFNVSICYGTNVGSTTTVWDESLGPSRAFGD
jgi:hypothetical protein